MSEGDELPEDVRAFVDAERAGPPLSNDALNAARARFEAELRVATLPSPARRATGAGTRIAAALGVGMVAGALATVALRPPREVVREVVREVPAVVDAGAVDARDVDARDVDADASVATDVGGRPRARLRPVAASTGADSLARERLVLQRARSALLRRDAAAALESLRLHAREFVDGALVEEREAMRIEALTILGRMDEARARVRDFHRRWPASLLSERVDRAVQE